MLILSFFISVEPDALANWIVLAAAVIGLFQRDIELQAADPRRAADGHAVAARRDPPLCLVTATKHGFKEIAEITTTELIAGIGAATKATGPGTLELLTMLPVSAETIIGLALFRIFQYLRRLR